MNKVGIRSSLEASSHCHDRVVASAPLRVTSQALPVGSFASAGDSSAAPRSAVLEGHVDRYHLPKER